MTETDDPQGAGLALAESLATRLCHDLAGMLGTVMGALELASSDAEMAAEALPVAQDAARLLGQRLRLLRAAWGGPADARDSQEQTIGMAELRELAQGLPLARRTTLQLDALAAERCFTPAAAQVLLNVLLLAVESLHGAGEVMLSGAADGDVLVGLDGPKAAWPTGLAAMLADAALAERQAATAQRQLQGPLTALLAHRAGIKMSLLLGPMPEHAPPLLLRLDGPASA